MESKKQAEQQAQLKLVNLDFQLFLEDLEILNLQDANPTYDVERYLDILKIIRMMGRNKRSVAQVYHMLGVIFVVSDVVDLQKDRERQIDCIVQKFKLCHDLAKTLRISIQDLLINCPSEICGKITYILIQNGDAVSAIEYFMGVNFYLQNILPRSWYFLISEKGITFDQLQKTLLEYKWYNAKLDLRRIRENLYECIAKIAFNDKLQYSQKKNLLVMMKNTFSFKDDQELIDLINSFIKYKENQAAATFETRLLSTLMKKLSYGKKYYLEKLMRRNEKAKTLRQFDRKQFQNQEFYNKKGTQAQKKIQRFQDALEFINKELKKCSALAKSDFIISFLETFKTNYPAYITAENEPMIRQNKLIQFITTVDLLMKTMVDEEYFQQALIMMTIYVLKLGIEYQDTVEISIFSMQILLNAIGLRQASPYLSRFFSLAVLAYMKFPQKSKIKKYTSKIVGFYVKEKTKITKSYFKEFQFLLLSKLSEISALHESVAIISSELYGSIENIETSLKSLVEQFKYGNEDIRLLNTTYILELLENQGSQEVRNVLIQPENLKIVYQGVLEITQGYKTEKSIKLSILSAKVIAAIGICQTFVNDPKSLKATNQMTLVGKKEQEIQKQGDDQNPNIIRSDYYNPLTNLRYKNQEQDNTLEQLAFPSFLELPIERKDIIKFGSQLLLKIISMTNVTDQKPQVYYYTQFLIDRFICSQKLISNNQQDQNQYEQIKEKLSKVENLSKGVYRYIKLDLDPVTTIEDPTNGFSKFNIKRLALFLIHKITDRSWQELFEACIPALKSSNQVLELLLPYLIYFAIRFNTVDDKLCDDIGNLFNKILDSNGITQIIITLRVQDFLKICLQQDKKIFKTFIENDTKFKYVEKLFHIDMDISRVKDQNVMNFIKVLDGNINVKLSFLAVKKIKGLLSKIDKIKKIKASRKVKAYQRCIYSFEDHFRSTQTSVKSSEKGFLDILTPDDTIDIVNFHRQLNPEDFDYGIFNQISEKDVYSKRRHQSEDQEMVDEERVEEEASQVDSKQFNKKFDKLMEKTQLIEYWKNGQWEYVQEWLSEIDITQFNSDMIFLEREIDNPIQKFEMLISIFVGEYHKGLQCLLRNDDTFDNPDYLASLDKINKFFNLLYSEFILSLDGIQGEISYQYKLYLHVIYELDSAVHFLKDAMFLERDKISEIIRKEVNRDKRRFEKVYYEFDMKNIFEKLLSWFEERSSMLQSSTESLKLIYYIRRMIFKLYDREHEYAFYLMKLAKIYRKTSNDILLINSLFKECQEYKHMIVDYDLEYAKYMLKTKNAHEAYQYLIQAQESIKQQCDNMYKSTKFNWMPQRVYEKAILLSIELQIKLDPHNQNILKRFDEFLKIMGKNSWEKPVFRYAQYLDELDNKNIGTPNQGTLDLNDQRKRQIQKIFYYINSLKHGYKYIWQSFPRALELWFEYNEKDQDSEKINHFMRQELAKLEVFKLASVLQILLSRYGHPKDQVREVIILVLSKVAAQFPGQCAWWIFHFLHFEQESAPGIKKNQVSTKLQAISRADFAKQLLGKIMGFDEQAYKKIIEGEKIFLELKKLSERSPPQPNSTTMELPQALQKVQTSSLVMPIEENLSPQLPPQNFRVNFKQSCLVSTTQKITELNRFNAEIINSKDAFDHQHLNDESAMEEAKNAQKEYPAYKLHPVFIAGFLNEATIMMSKEKPKKIGIIGSNKQVYNFLLKCDKFGDLRKEQRFIDFAVLCNKMLENDAESRKRNLRLRTNAIVPLSRNTGLIEWIQNTSTLKTIVGDYWKKNNIKGEMQDIKQKAISLKMGETHTQIWQYVKEDIKPVLGTWMADHFPSPETWYEARINFIRSTAIWSMIGYVIGLGDRHGDNILIHMHTGEVTHVDFDCIFEKGAKLKIPEIVPFRLTQNIMDAFGIFKEKGVYQRTCEVVERVLRKNAKNIISFLDSFIHDPLIESTQNIKVEIKSALDVVKQKLYGQIKGDQGGSVSVEDQVETVILHAINDESLSKMYIGWMPWL